MRLFQPLLTPVSTAPSLPASQFTVCTSRFTRLREALVFEKDPQRKFSRRICRGHPGLIRADVPGQKLRAGPRNLGKTGIWMRTVIHEPKTLAPPRSALLLNEVSEKSCEIRNILSEICSEFVHRNSPRKFPCFATLSTRYSRLMRRRALQTIQSTKRSVLHRVGFVPKQCQTHTLFFFFASSLCS